MDPLAALATELVPELAPALADAAVAARVSAAITAATGTNDATAARAVLQRQPALGATLHATLAGIAAEAARRPPSVPLPVPLSAAPTTTNRVWTINGQVVLSAIILLSFATILGIVLLGHGLMSAETGSLPYIMVGTLATMAAQVANYWLGTSSDSAAKSDHINELSINAQNLVPTEMVKNLLDRQQHPGG